MSLRRAIISTALSAAAAAAAGTAHAAPVAYNFTVGTPLFLNSELAEALGTDLVMTVQFTYDSAQSASSGRANLGLNEAMTYYAGNPAPLSDFFGVLHTSSRQANGVAFYDPRGAVDILNDATTVSKVIRDVLQLRADPVSTTPSVQEPIGQARDLMGMQVGDFKLSNVRLDWLSWSASPTEMLEADTLPSTLPNLLDAQLTLDFNRISDPDNLANARFYDNSIHFSVLAVNSITILPEAGTMSMMLLGILSMGALAGRRRSI